MKLVYKEPLGLIIDIENKPLWYGGNDFVYDIVTCVSWRMFGSDITGLATAWIDWPSGIERAVSSVAPLRDAMDQADFFIGHNFQHDIKGLQALATFLDQKPFPERRVVDTMRCMRSGPPRSMDYLVSKWGLGDKPHLSQHDWIMATLLADPEAIEKVKQRNRWDVLLTEKLYIHEKEKLEWL